MDSGLLQFHMAYQGNNGGTRRCKEAGTKLHYDNTGQGTAKETSAGFLEYLYAGTTCESLQSESISRF